MSRFYRNLFYKTLFFFIVWLVLSESFDRFHMGLGLGSAFAVAWLNTDRSPVRSSIRPIRLFGYVPWLVIQVVKSGVHLSKLILDPKLPISPQMVTVKTDLEAEGAIVLLANSITLTPGTITVEVNGRELLVHAIDDAAAEEVTGQQFDRQIGDMVRASKGSS